MTSSMFVDRGLMNKPGENNCFLNSAIQVCVCIRIVCVDCTHTAKAEHEMYMALSTILGIMAH